jgi:hypothetical protein
VRAAAPSWAAEGPMLIRWQYYGSFGSNGPPLLFVGVVLLLLSTLFVALVANDLANSRIVTTR